MCLKERIKKAKQAKVKRIKDHPSGNKVFQVQSLTDPARQYQVEISCRKMEQENRQVWAVTADNTLNGKPCKGSLVGYVTYHVIAALKHAAKLKRREFYACVSRERANRLVNLGGNLVVIQSVYRGERVWGVVK